MLCNGNYWCIILCIYIHGPFWIKVHLSINRRKIITYFKYISNIFLIWTGTKNELDQFFKDLSKKHPSIKFDYNASKNHIVFLDSEIYLHNFKLHRKLYREENDQQHYLHIKSEHPESLKDSLPYIQATQIKQISSSQVHLDNSHKE